MSEAFVADIYGGRVTLERDGRHRYKVTGEGDEKPQPCPGVTSILGMKGKGAGLIKWAVNKAVEVFEEHVREVPDTVVSQPELVAGLMRAAPDAARDKAAAKGTVMHAWIEGAARTLATGATPDIPEVSGEWTDDMQRGATCFLEWIERNGIRIRASERPIYSKAHHYAGQCDLILTDRAGAPGVWDVKTGKAFYPEVLLQTAAYQQALIEEGVTISPEGTPIDGRAHRGCILFLKDDDQIFRGIRLWRIENRMAQDWAAFMALKTLYGWNRNAMQVTKAAMSP